MSFSMPMLSSSRRAGFAAVIALLIIAALIGLSVVQAATIGPVTNVSNDPVESQKSKVAQDPQGNVHIVWDSTENGNRVIRYAKGIWNGSSYQFGPSFVLGSVGGFQFAGPNLIVAPNGTIMVAWSRAMDRLVLRAWDSSSNQPGGSNTEIDGGIRVSIAPDSAGRFHLVYDRDFLVQYCEWSGNGCARRDVFPGSSSVASVGQDVAVDRQGNVHVVWQLGQSIKYRARPAGGEWRNVEDLGGGTVPSITADGRGNVHIVKSENYDIVYCRKTLDTPCVDRRTFDADSDVNPSIGVTRSGSIVVAFHDNNPRIRGLWYNTLENGQWSGTNFVSGTNANSQPDVTSRPYSNRISFVWDLGFDIQHTFITLASDECDFYPADVAGAGEVEAQQFNAARRLYLPLVFHGPDC